MIKLITHTDLDGVGCYLVAKYFYDTVDASYCGYDNVNMEIETVLNNHDKYSKIFITDLSCNKITAQAINKINKLFDNKVVLIDHHKTALHLNSYSWANVVIQTGDKKNCGTELFYEYLLEEFQKEQNDDLRWLTNHLGKLVEKIRRYDTWEWKDKYGDTSSKHLNDLLNIYGRDKFINNMLCKLYPNEEDLISEFEFILLELEQDKIKRYVEKKRHDVIEKIITCKLPKRDRQDYKFGVVFADNYISELGNGLAEIYSNLDFIAIFTQNTVSLRTVKDNIDLSDLAKLFKGGGHCKASGFTKDKEDIDNHIRDVFWLFGEISIRDI